MNSNSDVGARIYGALSVLGGIFFAYAVPYQYAQEGKYAPAVVLSLLALEFIADGVADIITGKHHFLWQYFLQQFPKRRQSDGLERMIEDDLEQQM